MQKISGILSGSPRVLSVDMKDAPPVRPGTPGFGRPEGVSSLRDRASAIDAVKRARELQDGQMAIRSKETEQAEMASKLAEGFFLRNMRDAEPASAGGSDFVGAIPVMAEEVAAQSRPAGFNHDAAQALREPVVDPEVLYPKGSFIDKVA